MPKRERIVRIGPAEVKRGRCRLCGKTAALTKTHVPPKATGNSGVRRSVVERTPPGGAPILDLGRESDGGIWLRRLCESCNSRTGRWDELFLVFQKALLGHVHDPARRPVGQLVGQFTDVSPGAFIRSVWAGMFAIDAISRDNYGDLAESVLSGDPVAAPTDVRLLVALTKSERIFVSSQTLVQAFSSPTSGSWTARGSGLVAPGPVGVDIPLAVVQAPPFVFVLARSTDPYELPHENLSAWLEDDARVRRATDILLPMARVRDGLNPVSYDDIIAVAA
jgi:hypothetical protein